MEFITLKKNNFELFRNRVPEKALSKTFEESIIIARELGFPYIWIDSLCIIQDDPEDWVRESGMMSSVYGCSSINIAASGALDGSLGCFFDRPSTWRCQVQIEMEGQLCRYECLPSAMYYRSISSMPLLRRGWALQERLLAPRTLHFTSTQLFWECHHKVACESFPERFPTAVAYGQSYFKKQPFSRPMWSWLVEQYSHCDLTFTKDKLVAISGLARTIQRQTGDQYIAGMWRKDLEFQLCWYSSIGQDVQRAVPYRAPTWSWASLDCLINVSLAERFNDSSESTHLWIRILHVQLQFSGPDPLGQLSAANLCLSASCLLRVTFQHGDDKSYMIVGKNNIKVVFNFDCPREAERSRMHGALALPVYGSSSTTTITGLLLEPTGQERGQYRRLGQFRIYKAKHSKAFEEASTDRSCQLKESEFSRIRKDKYGKQHYIINVI
jgi:Heterokaryon incompatibility protein (HET)